MRNFEERLTGGHPNSLGNTIEVVEEVLQHHEAFDELFNCYFSTDEVVRLRVSNAMRRVYKEAPPCYTLTFHGFLLRLQPLTKRLHNGRWLFCSTYSGRR